MLINAYTINAKIDIHAYVKHCIAKLTFDSAHLRGNYCAI